MAQENVEIVRQPIAVRAHSRRSVDQRLWLRFPGLLALVAEVVGRLSPRSRLRQATLKRGTRLSFEANNRRDYAASFLSYRQDGESIYPPDFASVGVGTRLRGRMDRIDFQRRWDADWGEFRNEPEELIDLGDRVVVLGRFVGSGASSGASFDREIAYLFTQRGGLIAREQVFLSHSEALEAAGLSE